VNLADQPAKATFRLKLDPKLRSAEVRGESRELAVQSASFTDSFAPYEVHLYRLKAGAGDSQKTQ